MILTLVSLFLAVGGIVLMSRGGVPESVSGLVYNLPVRRRWLWSGWLVAECVCAISLYGALITVTT